MTDEVFNRWPFTRGVRITRNIISKLTTWTEETKPRQAISPQPGGVCISRPFMNRHTHADTHETVGNNSDTMNTNHISVTQIKCAWIVPNLKFKKTLMFKELPIPKKFQSEKISPVCKNPASLRADWRGSIAYEKCQHHPLRISPSCGDAGGVNDPVQWQNKFSKLSRRNKNPHQPKPVQV